MTGLAYPIYTKWVDKETTKEDAIKEQDWAREPWVDGKAHLWKRKKGLDSCWRSICGATYAYDIVKPTKYTEKCKRCLRIVCAANSHKATERQRGLADWS